MAQITVTATLKDIFGNALAGMSGVYVQLCGYGSQIPRVSGVGVIAQTTPLEVQPAAGVVTFAVYGNDVISPVGTYYTVQAVDAAGNVIQVDAFQFMGTAAVDLSSAPIYYPDGGAPPGWGGAFIRLTSATNLILPAPAAPAVTYGITMVGAVATCAFAGLPQAGQIIAFLIEQGAIYYPFNYPAICVNTAEVPPYANAKSYQSFLMSDEGIAYSTGATSIES